jgi:dienelactone hydrolase
MNLYGGVVHSFTNPAADARNVPDFARFDADADRHSWNDLIELLGEAI